MITGCLNMSLNNPSEYWNYSYISERGKISKKLKQGFIDGIINASKYRKNLKMHTHKWMIEEVVHSKEIQSRFDIKIIKNEKPMKISTEILILISKEEFEENIENIYKIIERERDSFNVMFKKK
jgi:Ni,Fe-hydrogenase maturation factor